VKGGSSLKNHLKEMNSIIIKLKNMNAKMNMKI